MAESTRDRIRSATVRFGVALLAVGVAVALRLALHDVIPLASPFLLLFAAVMLSATFGGLGPGVLATLLAALASDIFLTGWPQQTADWRITDQAQVGVFFLEGLFLSVLGAMLYRARRTAEAADAAARKLEQKMIEIGEGERRRIGHDLHDGLGQHLTGIALLATGLRKRLRTLDLPESEQAARVEQLVNESIGWTRDLAKGLSPVTLDSDGLPPALEELATNASKLLGINCVCDWDGTDVPLDGETSLHLYRIAQEAVNNSVRHGGARNVTIRLSSQDGRIDLQICDDGGGISGKTLARPGIGLQIMQYRARMVGATVELSRPSGRSGAIVTCSVPVKAKREQEAH